MANYPYAVPAEQAFMGKARTYSEPTQFRQYAVRLRALKENPRNPAELGAIGPQGDWAVDDPSAIVEEGSNSNGSYVLQAGGYLCNKSNILRSTPAGVGSYGGFTFPMQYSNTLYYVALIQESVIDHVSGLGLNARSVGGLGFMYTETGSNAAAGRSISWICKVDGTLYAA